MKKTICLFACLLAGTVSAGAVTGLEIGIRTGIIENYHQPNLSIATYDLDRLNQIGGQLWFSKLPIVNLVVGADYSWRKRTYTIANQAFEFQLRDLSVTASVVYPVKLPVVTPYVGAGVGTHSLSYEYLRAISLSLADNGVSIPETSTYFGYHGLIGVKADIPVFPVGVFGEARVTRVNAPQDDISFTTWAGGIYLALP
jgi:opacity protein-like surface antigen